MNPLIFLLIVSVAFYDPYWFLAVAAGLSFCYLSTDLDGKRNIIRKLTTFGWGWLD